MDNVLEIGKVPYQGFGPQKPLSIKESVFLYLKAFMDISIVLICLVPILLFCLCRNIFYWKKKVIRGQCAVVTGGANGIGKQIAVCLAKEQCNVVIADIDETEGVKTADLISQTNKSITVKYYKVNVADPKSVTKLKDDIEREIGTVDILVNCAGLIPMLSVMEKSDAEIDFVVDANVKSIMWTCRAFLKGMIERKRGHILTVASMCSFHPSPYAALYTGTKYFQRGFIDALREQIRQDKLSEYIKLTSIYPYFVATRKDLMDVADLRFPPITPEHVGHAAVDSLLRNKNSVSCPTYLMSVQGWMSIMPLRFNQFVRDILFKENISTTFKFPSSDS